MSYLTNKERARRALDGLEEALAGWLERRFAELHGDEGLGRARALFPRNRRPKGSIGEWDLSKLLGLLKRCPPETLGGLVDRALVCELLKARNRDAHGRHDISGAEADRVCALVGGFVRAISTSPGPRALGLFDERMDWERGELDWARLLDTRWPAEWIGRPTGALSDGGVHPRFVSGELMWIGRYEGVELCILPADVPHDGRPDSPATRLAEELLARSRDRNSVVFLALDGSFVGPLRSAVRRVLAWEWVSENPSDLDSRELEGLDAELAEARREVAALLRVGYRWLLVPSQPQPGSAAAWTEVPLPPSPDPLAAAERALEQGGHVRADISPDELSRAVRAVASADGAGHVRLADLGPAMARELHLPRLRDGAAVIRAAVQAVTRREPGGLGYALTHDPVGGYGFLYHDGNGPVQSGACLQVPAGYLVLPEAARGQLARLHGRPRRA